MTRTTHVSDSRR